jgi:hypothetical protein
MLAGLMCGPGLELILQAAGKYGQTVGGLMYSDGKMLPPPFPVASGVERLCTA